MAKLILEFDTETENNEMMRCINATSLFLCVYDLLEEMRYDLKHHNGDKDTLYWQDFLLGRLETHNIDMDWLD